MDPVDQLVPADPQGPQDLCQQMLDFQPGKTHQAQVREAHAGITEHLGEGLDQLPGLLLPQSHGALPLKKGLTQEKDQPQDPQDHHGKHDTRALRPTPVVADRESQAHEHDHPQAQVILKDHPVAKEVSQFRRKFTEMKYCLPEAEACSLVEELLEAIR